MSILNVEHLTHGFGDRAIFNDVSFRLLKGEHIGLVGANGEGKSTFMSIVTGKMLPDEGKVEWSKNVHAGYLDQHAVLEKGMTIRQALKSAFDPLLQKEQRMNEICDMLGTADEEEMNALMEELGTIQDELTLHDFYTIDAKVEEVARALGLLDLGLDRDVTDLSGGQRTKVLLAKLLLEKPDILLLDEPTNYLDEEHIAWLKRYLLDYENAFILISHDIPFLNEVVNIIYHMENQELNRYVGDYDHFQEVYAVKKAQLEAALQDDFYEELFSTLKSLYPQVRLHALEAPEVAHIARISGLTTLDTLKRLIAAGLDSLPGAGAEILDPGVRKAISPAKPTVEEWIQVMHEAHCLNLPTSATMMYGHVETPRQRVDHLLRIRDLQARCPEGHYGFLAFIPWIFRSSGTELERQGVATRFSPLEYIRIIAVSRLVLNNIRNIQASWLTVGKATAQVALHSGANDMGSIMIEENVVSSAGAHNQFDAAGIQQAIREAGFTPRLRDQLYRMR